MAAASFRPATGSIPTQPGVYRFRDARGRVIYVGKAKNLRSRVRSYFRARPFDRKTDALVGQIADLEFIVTDNEVEALILEASLVKQHKPRYNIKLQDDKSYPHLKLTINEPFPKVVITRRVRSFQHARLELVRELFVATFKQQTHVAHSLLVLFRRTQSLDARPEAAFDVILETRPRRFTVDLDVARAQLKRSVY